VKSFQNTVNVLTPMCNNRPHINWLANDSFNTFNLTAYTH